MHDNASNSPAAERLTLCCGGRSSAPAARAALRQAVLLLLLAPTVLAIPASAADPEGAEIICHPLLLDRECSIYKAGMSSATGSDAKHALKARYAVLVSQRERACYCRPERSWIRLSRTATVPLDRLHPLGKTVQDKLGTSL